jgi:anaerobic ribonucleoside-triphosphate reductase
MDEAVTKVEVNAVRLQQAVLCSDCDVITDSQHDACLVCGSHALLPLSRILGEIRPSELPMMMRKTNAILH